MRSLPWRFLGLAVVAGMASPLALFVFRDRCLYWTAGPMPGLAVAVVALNCIVGAAYFGIPLELWRAARGGHLPLPWWLRWALVSYALFILSCGVTHFERALVRPIVYCAESVAILGVCAALSVASWVGTRLCRPAIEAMLSMLGALPGMADTNGAFATPGLAAGVLRAVERRLKRHARPPSR
jgi:hypothetical protein